MQDKDGGQLAKRAIADEEDVRRDRRHPERQHRPHGEGEQRESRRGPAEEFDAHPVPPRTPAQSRGEVECGKPPRQGFRAGTSGAGPGAQCGSAQNLRRKGVFRAWLFRSTLGTAAKERSHELEPRPRPRHPDSAMPSTRSRPSSSPAPATSAGSRCAARCPRAAPADGRPLHLLRPDGPGGVPDRAGDSTCARTRISASPPSPTCIRGRIHHRDSLGTDQWIEPGAVNWMVAGQGITHSERTDDATRGANRIPCSASRPGSRCRRTARTTPPPSSTAPGHALPVAGGRGQAGAPDPGHRLGRDARPSRRRHEMFYADAAARPRRRAAAAGRPRGPRRLCRWRARSRSAGRPLRRAACWCSARATGISVKAGGQGARLMLLGGATMDGPRYIWWNFVASSSRSGSRPRRRPGARATGQHGRFRLPPGDDAEFIPLPDR